MKRYPILLSLIIPCFILTGCVIHGLSMRTILDPQTKLTKESKIYIDPFRDTEIKYRKAMAQVVPVAKEMGLNVVQKEDADFVMFLRFRKDIQYNATRDQFEQIAYIRATETQVRVRGNISVDLGIIDSGVFKINGGEYRTEWEGSIEVDDINDSEELHVSLSRLFERFAEDFRGEVPGLGTKN
ncbi:MAG: hypothetical protein MI748_02415 [Opitutales bacterium]|nr:hypothetical protein [Opitutales bacterium]